MGTHLHDPTSPVARKAHKCIACLHPIAAGEKHVHQTGFFDGRAFRNRFHRECWDTLNEEGEFEFSPGDLDPPERLTPTPPAAKGVG